MGKLANCICGGLLFLDHRPVLGDQPPIGGKTEKPPYGGDGVQPPYRVVGNTP